MPEDVSNNLHPSAETWCAYVDGSLAAADAEQLAAHLQQCDVCFARVASLRSALAEAESGLDVPTTPPELLARGAGPPPRLRRLRLIAAVAAAVLAGVVLWTVLRTFYPGQPQVEEPIAAETPSLEQPPAEEPIAAETSSSAQPPAAEFFVEGIPPETEEFGYASQKWAMSPHGTMNFLVIFAQFQNEVERGVQIPDYAARLFDPNHEGSFTHFYDTMSFGQLKTHGEVLPRYYTSDRPASAYLARGGGERGRYPEFVDEILTKADPDIDYARFDNDGPDGVPDSGDDDGLVDYVCILMRSVPTNFIMGKATGIADLGGDRIGEFRTRDTTSGGDPVRVNGYTYRGTILHAGTFAQTVAVMAHEFGHCLGLPDLYDQSDLLVADSPPDDDGAGIGRWGLMGNGAQGWRGNDGPTPFSAWSREFMGWIGRDNDRRIEVHADTTVSIAPLDQGGNVFKIPLYPYFESAYVGGTPKYYHEYLLLEHRERTAGYYDRNLPATGLLIWHIRPQQASNDDEDRKLVDLVCADGLYADAGYKPAAKLTPEPHQGRDNLDYWAHDSAYASAREGNNGDPTDIFDGILYSEFGPHTNPSTAIGGRHRQANSGLHLAMERRGESMEVSISLPRWSGTLADSATWMGEIRVDGDLTIAPEGYLEIYPATRVKVAPGARIRVEGELVVRMTKIRKMDVSYRRLKPQGIAPEPVVMESAEPGRTWLGLQQGETASLQFGEADLILRDLQPADPQLATATEEPGEGRGEDSDPSPVQEQPEDIPTAVLETEFKPLLAPPAESPTFALLPNYPNPFSQQTTLRYQLPEAAHVRLTIYSALGQELQRLVDERQWEGLQEEVWDSRDESGQEVADGVYIYTVELLSDQAARDPRVKQGKMMRLKGYAMLDPLDRALREQGAGWTQLGDDLSRPLEEEAFGFAVQPSPAQAAFTIGSLSKNLQVLRQYADDPGQAAIQAGILEDLLPIFDPSAAQQQNIVALLEQLGTFRGSATQRARLLARVRLGTEQLVCSHSEAAAAHFYLGEWLQSLKAAALAARDLSLPLGRTLDLATNTATCRHLTAFLKTIAADSTTTAPLNRLTVLLEAGPSGRRDLNQVIDLLENMAASIR